MTLFPGLGESASGHSVISIHGYKEDDTGYIM